MKPDSHAYGERGGRAPRRRGSAALAALIVAAVALRPVHHRLLQSIASRVERKEPAPPLAPPLFAKGKRRRERNRGKPEANARNGSAPPAAGQGEEKTDKSDAPLFYHASPGSTGSRTLYHAACSSGFPSVHHKSFCISKHRGIDGVASAVVEGVRAHYEVLRLYQMAADCCSLWNKGRIKVEEGRAVVLGNGSDDTSVVQELCSMPLREWCSSVQFHLKAVVGSGLVGLFDTPYPYLAKQVLELAEERRGTPPIIAMTERDPEGWAASRSRNHGVLVCREEYSHEGMGASEFDVIGCVDRAHGASSNGRRKVLHFWDAFRYRSRKEPINGAFQRGMERQMARHQEIYLPLASYTPDFFRVHSPKDETANPIKEKDVAVDIRRNILGRERRKGDGGDINLMKLTPTWRKRYATPLACRGRVDWSMANDTLVEHYHLPKTCEGGDDLDATIPLI